MITDTQFEKLPKYAQHEIERQRMDIKHLEDRLAAMGTGESLVWMGLREMRRVFLPDDESYTFVLAPVGEKPEWWHELKVRIETLPDGTRQLNLNGGHGLSVRATATNLLTVRVER